MKALCEEIYWLECVRDHIDLPAIIRIKARMIVEDFLNGRIITPPYKSRKRFWRSFLANSHNYDYIFDQLEAI